jgi:hypothetical protein
VFQQGCQGTSQGQEDFELSWYLFFQQKALSYSVAAQPPAKGKPIHVAPKPKHRKKLQNVFLDDRGFPDQSDEYDHLLHSIDGGPVLRKLCHPMPNLDGPIDPPFDHPFIPEEHKDIMRKQADLSHLNPNQQEQVNNLIREFWSVFDKRGVFVPVKNYECVIDTGPTRLIAVKKILYGEQETVIMQRCILAFAKVGHI